MQKRYKNQNNNICGMREHMCDPVKGIQIINIEVRNNLNHRLSLIFFIYYKKIDEK